MPIVKGFRRFQSNIVSFRQVVTETLNLVAGSNVQQSGWSSVAPSTPKKKRITSADRRALLESFVNKYRAMNSGKFPTPKTAQNEVGGGYYSIRKILQEMEHNCNISSIEKKETKEQSKDKDTVSRETGVESFKSQKVSNSQIAMDQNLYEDPLLESVSNVDTKSIVKDDTRDQCDEKLENLAKDDGIKDIIRDMPGSKKDEELRQKSSSSIWGNLKTLASGFINMWKKQ